MKKNISILVVFSLLLAFGMLVASCDNGVLPKHDTDLHHIEAELDGVSYNSLNPGGALPSPSVPADTSAWADATADLNKVYLDYFTGTPTIDFINGVLGVLPGDNTIDAVGGTDLYISVDEATALVGQDVYVGTYKTPWKFRAVLDGGGTKKVLKIAS